MSRDTVTGLSEVRCGDKRITALSEAWMRSDGKYGQARKGSWWMPRSYCTMKAVVSCEKPGGGAHIPRSPDSRMG